MLASAPHRVLIVTGTMISVKERSFAHAIRKQVDAVRASSGAWLDVHLKVLAAENLVAQRRYMGSSDYRRSSYAPLVDRLFDGEYNEGAPELTEVSLMTLLAAEGIAYEATTYAEIYADKKLRDRLLEQCDVVFASTTLLRDQSELEPMMMTLDRPHNRVVIGGALTGILHHGFKGCRGVDLMTVGYGELLVPALARWIKSDFAELEPPETGRVEERGGIPVLYSGVPESKNLDDLPSPDWTLAEAYHERKFRMVHYESVRGCPYRCAFCNYPYLFDDTKFRYKSAERIADDWETYRNGGAEVITCLDSLFTMPRRRLRKLCQLLIEREIDIKWICYARADDLADLDTTRLMKEAGCIQVQIGIESGSQQQLDNMNKRCTVDKNRQALANCREVGLTSLVTVILGFPGETEETILSTYRFLKETRPDFFYVAPFNTRVEYVPILNADNRKRFGIVTNQGASSSAPYWRHDTMDAAEMGRWWKWMTSQLIADRAALEGSLFYKTILDYDHRDRDALLDFQRDILHRYSGMRRVFGALGDWVQRKLDEDLERVLGDDERVPAAKPAPPALRPSFA